MPIPVQCPKCRHAFRVPDEYAGKRGKCPKCKAVFVADDVPEFPSADGDAETALANSGAKTVVAPKPKSNAKGKSAAPPPTKKANIKAAQPLAKAAPLAQPEAVSPAAEANIPIAAPSGSPPGIAAPGIATSSSGSSEVYASRRKKNSGSIAAIAVGLVVMVALLAVAGFVAKSMLEDATVAQQDPGGSTDGSEAAAPPPPPPTDSSASEEGGVSTGAIANWETIEKSIVDIAVIDRTGKTQNGRGVIIDSRGWVATSFMLTRDATGAVATFAGGEKSEFTGVLVGKPAYNLALLQLEMPEGEDAELPALNLAEGWEPQGGERVYLGTRNTALATTLAGMSNANSIPPTSKHLLPGEARERGGLPLITHANRLPEGQGGAPLLTGDGRVAGITFDLGLSRQGYSVFVIPIAEMLAEANPSEVKPFSQESDPTEPLPPIGTPVEIPKPFERFQAVADRLAEFGFTPQDAEHYEGFQLLAAGLNAMQTIIDQNPDDALSPQRRQLRQQLEEMIQSTMEKIAAAGMPEEKELARINQLGMQSISESDQEELGIYLYGECVMTPADFGARFVDGEPGFAFKIIGTEEIAVMGVGIPENGQKIQPGSRWLILGVLNPEERYRIQVEEDGEPRQTLVVRSKYLLGDVSTDTEGEGR